MKRTHVVERVIGLVLVSLLLAACASSSDFGQTTPTAEVEDDRVQWDLLWVTDCFARGGHVPYAKYIEQDLGVRVAAHDRGIEGLSPGEILAALRGEESHRGLAGLPDLVREAEVIVFYAGPFASVSQTRPGEWNCVSTDSPHVEDCSRETFDLYHEQWDAILDEILALRDGKSTIVRTLDAYAPGVATWKAHGVSGSCMQCWETWNEVIYEVSAAHNVPVARVLNSFNGDGHNEDPDAKGLIRTTGILPSGEGVRLIAQALRELGYEPVAPGVSGTGAAAVQKLGE